MSPHLSSRQLEILDAAVTVLAQSGARGLTHRAVDRAAGLPEGSTSAYFRSRAALLSALTEVVAARLTSDVAALGEQQAHRPGDHEFAITSTVALLTDWLATPDTLTARLELALASTREPEVASIMASAREQLVDLVTQIIARAGTPTAGSLGATTVAALDGVLLVALQLPGAERGEFAARSVRVLLDALTDPRLHRDG